MTKAVDNAEVQRFGAIAGEWWDPNGKFAPLHRINPVRLAHIRREILTHTGRDANEKPLADMDILDIGCGGGLICEPLARLGAQVTGIDPSPESIAAAGDHAAKQNLPIEYLTATSEEIVSAERKFDCVLALEVIEHVPDAARFLESCAALVKPGGLLLLSTLSRTAKSFALGIVAAEYVLGWLPKGTHQWRRFVTPNEMRQKLINAGLSPNKEHGLIFDPVSGKWSLSDDCSVNYFISATKPLK